MTTFKKTQIVLTKFSVSYSSVYDAPCMVPKVQWLSHSLTNYYANYTPTRIKQTHTRKYDGTPLQDSMMEPPRQFKSSIAFVE